jgi:iron complex transport system substrate-binding protein
LKHQTGTASYIACTGIALLLCPLSVRASISIVDDTGRTVMLAAPARRIVSLAPHTTELLYAAGAGAAVVGVSEYSDYPPQARHVRSLGSAVALDLERIITLKPDLAVVWSSGNSATQVARLRQLGIPVFESEPRDFAGVASSLERLAQLAATEKTGYAAAATFRTRLQALRVQYQHRPTVSVFYQVWHHPLMTLNDKHMVSAAIRLCGGENIFGKLPPLAPTVSSEAVIKADPEVIVSGASLKEDTFSGWRRFPTLTAVARDNLFAVNADWLVRAGLRILDGTEALCQNLEIARSRRK